MLENEMTEKMFQIFASSRKANWESMEGLMGVGEKQHEYEFHALIFFWIFISC